MPSFALHRGQAAQLKVQYSMPGFGWLVRDGRNAVAKPTEATEIAPRTTVGVTKDGTRYSLVMLEGDEGTNSLRKSI